MEAYQSGALSFGVNSSPWTIMMILRKVVPFVHHSEMRFAEDWLSYHHDPVVLLEAPPVLPQLSFMPGAAGELEEV